MYTAIVGFACLSFGLYAGRRRAEGKSWHEIACELARGVWNVAAATFGALAKPFRKGRSDGV